MYQQEERDWHKSAIKYYQSYRILQFLGYTKQGLNMLLTSVEKLLKTLIAIRLNLSEKELRERYNHSLKRLLADSNLDEKEFPNIFGISNKFQYNKIRYEFEVIPNIINTIKTIAIIPITLKISFFITFIHFFSLKYYLPN